MAARVLLVRPALPVTAIVSHLPVPGSASSLCPAISRTHPSAELTRLLCSRSSPAAESSCAHGSIGIRTRRTIFSAMSAGPSETQTVSMEEEEERYKVQERIDEHQKAATKLPRVVEARTVVDKITNGILSTISKKLDGSPVPSMVPYAVDEGGRILLCVSSLSPHTGDLDANPKCSMLVARDLNDRSDIVITVTGEAHAVSAENEADAKSAFLKKHPGAFWVDFGDFKMVRIEPKHVRFISGIAKGTAAVSQFSGDEFKAAAVDPISQFAAPIAHHMNRDHSDQTRMIVEHNVGIKVDSAIIEEVDSFGFYVLSQFEGKPLKLRIPFPRKAESRKDVKTLIVEMLSAATAK
ncbi:hypothetical protein AXG93_1793s1440 [Marchantia polymorpha subsp. ruderalis]|uniref:Uncharacterized protein n=1 Tax=Marchantia polymorpha subsp. ruderalis TaxID=1480154 RepID=A0A176WG59_MARPO|nr:hypothetical protein AXG93_1793s1440 [Marchantia polymorpha subsp. ruderalis]